MKMGATLLLFVAVLGGASAVRASSFKYTFTFDATSHSALTSYWLESSTLITSPTSFFASQLHLLTPPATGAIFFSPFPAAHVNGSGGVGGLFSKGSGSNLLEWELSGVTAPLKGLGTYPLLAGSTSFFNGDTTYLPVNGSVAISVVPQASAPEPSAVLLLSVGALFAGIAVKWRRRTT